jgi:NIMA (never in mitosis gene a)-related kinase
MKLLLDSLGAVFVLRSAPSVQVNILRELRHPFIVRYYDRIIDKESTRIYIVMEYCEGGDLGRVIKRCRRDKTLLDEEFVWKCFAQMVLALKDCHRHKEPVPTTPGGTAAAASSSAAAADRVKPILHRDLKPGNIFLDGARNVKVGDFGLAKELASESKYAMTNVGTPFYMSPEQINEQKYNEKSDICESQPEQRLCMRAPG